MMTYIFIIIAVLAVAFIAFILWRLSSVERGKRQCAERIAQLLEPLETKLSRKEHVPHDEVARQADKPHVRPMLYAMLKHHERLDLFPRQYLDTKSQGAADLAFWTMHPNELEDAPEEIELVESSTRRMDPDGEVGEFLVFKFKMAEGHWAAADGWLLGVAGPYLKNDVPYSGIAGASARCGDKFGAVNPAELVDWYIGMCGIKCT